ncbi:unnamed protein product, partial [Medioppia subpectinata]
MSGSDGQSSRVLNDDVLFLIFRHIDITDLFSIQRVSQQFYEWTQKALAAKTVLNIGLDSKELFSFNITKALIRDRCLLNYNPYLVLDSMLHIFISVKTLYLSRLTIDYETMEVIVNRLPQLKILYLSWISINRPQDKTVTEWTQLLSKVTQIEIHYFSELLVMNCIRDLPSLQSLEVNHMRPLTPQLMADCIPSGIRTLKTNAQYVDTNVLNIMAIRCVQLEALSLCDFNVTLEQFSIICNQFKRIKRLDIKLDGISTQELAQNISKLKDLKHLKLEFSYYNKFCFDTNVMMSYMKPITSLRSLSLDSIKCSAKRLTQLPQMLPNVTKISIGDLNCHIDCSRLNDYFFANECLHKVMQWLSRVPKLRHLTLDRFAPFLRLKTFNLFVDLIPTVMDTMSTTTADTNPLSNKINKILNKPMDRETLEALTCVSSVVKDNNLHSRRNLRTDIERQSLTINEEFVK